MPSNALKTTILFIGLCTSLFAQAEIGIYMKGGTLGAGGGVGVSLSDVVTARVGYTAATIHPTFHTQDVDYTGNLKLGGAELLLDWHPFASAFRVTGGAIFSRNNVDIDAKLNHSPIYVNGVGYDVNDIAAIDGKVKFRSTMPYLGIGWGNVVGKNGNFHFIADIGVEFMGSAKVHLKGSCAGQFQTTMAASCAQFVSDVQAEENDLNDDVSDYKWWPVLNIGLAYRF